MSQANGIADRFLKEALGSLQNDALRPPPPKRPSDPYDPYRVSSPKYGKRSRSYILTSDRSIVSKVGVPDLKDVGQYALCSVETFELLKERVEARVACLNAVASDRSKFPIPVEFKYSLGDDHIILWFEREMPDL